LSMDLRHTAGGTFRDNCSRIVAGMWRLSERCGEQGCNDFVAACLEHGVNTFDHADIYGRGESERLFGKAWRELGIDREQMVLISKCGNIQPTGTSSPLDVKSYDTSKAHILESVNGILTRLQTDYLDLLLIHRYDPFADFKEIAAAFDSLRTSGRVRFFGVSNYPPVQFGALNSYLGGLLVVNQVECSIFHPDPMMDGTLDVLQAGRLTPMAWSPLGGAFATRLAANPRLARVLESVSACSDGPEITALRWLLSHPSGIRPVIGTSRIERIKAAASACSGVCSRQEFFAILSAALGRDMP